MNKALSIFSLLLLSCCSASDPSPTLSPFEAKGLAFVKSLVNPTSGLVASREGECFTTVYKNALAAMVFIHSGDREAAEDIFDVFDSYFFMYANNFTGFPKDWNSCTGKPEDLNFWEGDNAFLLLALNYYKLATRDSIKYISMSQNLVSWLIKRSEHCDVIVAEGVANMYAALKPFAYDATVGTHLALLKTCFFSTGKPSSVSYAHVLDHTVRSSLIFGEPDGWDFVDNFKRTETWAYHPESIDAYSAFSNDAFINVEISAQLLLAGGIQDQIPKIPGLSKSLGKLWIPGSSANVVGLPYFITNIGFDQSATVPIIDPTAYMLFYYWRLNPFSPGKKCADCPS